MMPRHRRPTILPRAAKAALRHPCKVAFVIIKRTAGPGVEVAIKTSVKYMTHD
jgi:hypothetical protein